MKEFLARLYRHTPAVVTQTLLRAMNTSFRIGAAGVFLAEDGTVLVLRHVFRRRYPWGLPAGFLEADETPEDGVVRELKEETGLAGVARGVVGLHYSQHRHLELTVAGTVARAQEIVLCHEIFEAAFVHPDALPEAMPPEQKQMVQRVVAGAPVIRVLSP